MIDLTNKQKNYLIDAFLDGRISIFKDSTSREYVLSKPIQLQLNKYGWYDVYWDGEKVTSINAKVYDDEFAWLLRLGQ